VCRSRLSGMTLDSATHRWNISLPDRINVVAFVLGTAFVAMSVSAVGAPLGAAALPVMQVLETHVNWLVTPAATLLNCATVWLVLLIVRWLSTRGAGQPSSMLARNGAVFAAARVVGLVYLAGLVVGLVASEIRWFFDVPFFNTTQLSVRSVQGRVLMTVVLPFMGLALLVTLAPRILKFDSRRAAYSVCSGRRLMRL
jgi:hypothetical protein